MARAKVGVCLAAVLLLDGCSGFFVTPSTTSGGGTTGTVTGPNVVYVANVTTSTVSGFVIGSGTLAQVPNSPVSLGFVPQAETVTRNNAFLYLAGPIGIYAYGINSDGSLSAVGGGSGLITTVSVDSLDTSPDGQWLFGLDLVNNAIDVWQINSSTGNLSQLQGATYTVANAEPRALRVSPQGNYIFAALGTAGDAVFTLNTANGAVMSAQVLAAPSTLVSDNALAVDAAGATLFIARSGQGGGLAVYTIGSNGVLSPVAGSPFATGTQPYSVTLDTTGKYVYVANRGSATISGFLIGSGEVLTPLSGSPFVSGTEVSSLGAERTGTYLLAAAFGGSADLTLYSFDSTVAGKLDPLATAASGTDPAGSLLVALTH